MLAAQAWPWWAATYEQARLWPVPEGKDPGDAFALGVDLQSWILAGSPAVSAVKNEESCGISVAQPDNFDQPPPENGDLGASICGLLVAGVGEGEISVAAESVLPSEPCPSTLPQNIPADVLELAQMWQGLPVRIRWLPAAGGHRAMKPEHDPVYGRDRECMNDFLQRIWASQDVWEWLAANENDVVTAENFLELKG